MKTKIILTIQAVVILTFLQGAAFGQGNNNIEIRFLTAKFTDTTSGKNLVAFFLVSTRDSASFPPEVILPPKCTLFEDGREKVILFNAHNLAVGLYGDDVGEKDKDVYDLVKNLVNFHPKNPQMIIGYTIKDLNYVFKKMTLTPIFREKRNREIKIEKRIEFEVH